MSQPPTPRVKLPDVMPRKSIVPGPNSWALSATQGDPKKLPQPGQVTNREKYERRPMPSMPEKASDEDKLVVPKNRGYIQPATPLVYSNQDFQSHKGRAATDPVKPQLLFTNKPGSIAHLRQKFSDSKSNVDCAPSSPPLLSEKASQILGVWPFHDNSHDVPPASAPPTTNSPDAYRISSDDHSAQSINTSRQVQSSPAATRRYLRENEPPTHQFEHTSLAMTAQTPEEEEASGQISEDPENIVVHPTRARTFDRVNEAEYVEGRENRVTSYAGVIENAESVDQTGPTQNLTESQECDAGTLLSPTVYSPSNYGGVWENDPDVGYTLPVFSPLRPHHRQDPHIQGRDSSQGSGTTVPVVLRAYYPPPSRVSGYPPSTSSVNSWAPSSQGPLGNSFVATDPPPSTRMRPQIPQHNMINAAPTPPRTYPGFQPSGPMPAALAQLELTLHHHIESCFGSLSRLVTDKHDRIMDQIIRRLESLEEMFGKWQKSGRGDIKDIKKDISNLKAETKDVVKGSDAIRDLIKALDVKIEKLEKKVEESGCKCRQHASPDMSGSELERPGAHQATTLHRRAESVQASENPLQRQPYQSGTSHSSSGRHQSGNSSRGHRSNTVSGGGQVSASGSSRREYFENLGAARSPAPDLREHPAFSGVQLGYSQGYDASGMTVGLGVSDAAPFQPPSLSEGWYQRVYGQ